MATRNDQTQEALSLADALNPGFLPTNNDGSSARLPANLVQNNDHSALNNNQQSSGKTLDQDNNATVVTNDGFYQNELNDELNTLAKEALEEQHEAQNEAQDEQSSGNSRHKLMPNLRR